MILAVILTAAIVVNGYVLMDRNQPDWMLAAGVLVHFIVVLFTVVAMSVVPIPSLHQHPETPEVAPQSLLEVPDTRGTINYRKAHVRDSRAAYIAASTNVEPMRTHWDDLADCESGEWNRHAQPIEGTADWSSTEHSTFEGGLQFHPQTWDAFAPSEYPDSASVATRAQEIEVGRRVQQAQGFEAWPVCARKVGLIK